MIDYLIPITKAEKEELAKLFPRRKFPRTMKQDSKRGHYFCVEDPNLLRELNKIRSSHVIERHPDRKSGKKKVAR